jgi:hypothetical protein
LGEKWEDVKMREGLFEEMPNSGRRSMFRLRWLPEQPLNDQEKKHAEFVRYLIGAGRLSEKVNRVEA